MKKLRLIWCWTALLLLCMSCGQKKDDGRLEFDLSASYPPREFPYDDMFSRYISIESDSLAVGNLRSVYIGENLFIGAESGTGNIFFIDGAGKVSAVVNKKGNSSEEYLNISSAFYDQEKEEIYILDAIGKKILVLERWGNTARRFDIEKGHGILVIMDFNEEGFITYNCNLGLSEDLYGSYTVLSKKDGKVLKDYPMSCPGGKRYASVVSLPDYISIWKSVNMIPGDGYMLLSEAYCDTVYKVDRKTYGLEPYLVKNPAFGTLEENKKMFLEPCLETPEYLMFVKITATANQKNAEFRAEEYFYDKKEKKFYKMINEYGDARKTGPFYNSNYNTYGRLAYSIDPGKIMEMRERGQMDPGLEKASEGMGEDNNPVIKVMNFIK